ncbi:lipopolysaccharide biosynthesis protein [Mycobacterium sp. BMJ-28]
MPQNAKQRESPSAKKAGLVTVVGQLAKLVIQFVGLVAFSRILSPHDIGLIAMLAVFLTLGELIRDFGISQAAVQTKNLSHGQASNLFWTNALIGLLMTLILIVMAPVLATVYHEPALRSITPWVSASFAVNALQIQFQVRLTRDHRFTALTMTDAISQLVGLVFGLGAALASAGYWAIVVQMLSAGATLLLQRALLAGWWPGPPRRESGMAALYLYGLNLGLSQILNYGASNADSFIIGVRWGASALGIYSRAFQIFTVPANQLLTPLTNVALPLLSRQRHDGQDFYPSLLKAQTVISTSFVLVCSLTAALAEPLITVVLGTAWLDSAPLLAILSIGGAIQVLTIMQYWAFLASGNTRQLFRQSLVTKPLQIGCIVVGALGGLEGVAWGYTGGLLLSWLVSMATLQRCDAMPASVFLRAGARVLACGFAAGGSVWVLITYLGSSLPWYALLPAGAAATVALYLPLALWNRQARIVLVDVYAPIIARVGVFLRRWAF